MTLRPLPRSGDVDAGLIASLVGVFRHARRRRLQFLIDLHDEHEDANFLRSVVLPKNHVWLAEANGDVAGFIAFADGWVNHLYVAPPHQGRGIGSQLLAVAQARSAALQLWAFEVNEPAIRFYERREFRIVEKTDGSANEAKQPDVRMSWNAGPG
jgi:GNAT superfamily N-acetyltransferase